MAADPKAREDADRAALSLALAETGVRNSRLEELHAGTFPQSAVGDYSDVKVVTPYGEIPWARVSRLCDEEMKGLMIEVVDRLYTVLTHPEPFSRLMGARTWNAPALDPAMMVVVARHEARQTGMAEADIWTAWPLDAAAHRPPLRRDAEAIGSADGADEAQTVTPVRAKVEASPEGLRALADAPLADPAWIAQARQALAAAADNLERAQLDILDEIEAAAYGQD
ncbi:hypothetical protein [Caulobacter sp. RHG1]|uniref:hypothetical protein n=1 Tax=Caulobacter sp. (strain RHG1) TaxID=2545762 RepID=UPI0018855420|nr:hypothetical protein [Caulobacter sp. RHG1]NQE61515.1 hypothetical protein [Caulobacter sp. RHG1]